MAKFEPPTVSIRALREAHGLTLQGLADRIATEGVEVAISTISNVECGNQRAGKALMAAWARALGIHPLDVKQSQPRGSASDVDRDADADKVGAA